MAYYQERYIVQFKGNEIDSFFNLNESKTTLKKALEDLDKIILLGNPGIGKTTELNHLFDELWEEKTRTGIVPIYINLKYFRTGNKFDDIILYQDWQDLPQVIFILDGLDEVVDIQDFISAFQLFININRQGNSKYVISCRTNIYDKYLVDVVDFNPFFLEVLDLNQITKILDSKHSISLSSLNYNQEIIDLLSSPFFLDLFAEYFKNKSKLPSHIGEIWTLYINKTIERDREKFAKRGILNKGKIIHSLRKIAIVNELMHRNYIGETDLYEILGEFSSDIIEVSLLEKNVDSKNWSFSHRQIQEYFVADTLTTRSFEEILGFIKIDDVNAIYPSIYNSLSFTIDLFQKDNQILINLLDWLKEHQPNLLFKADSNKFTDELRKVVFQDYFKKECIEKKLWINTNRTIDVNEIASFADTEANFKFLIEILSNEAHHFRIRYSAIELISYFRLSPTSKVLLKKIFINIIRNSKSEEGIIAEVINAVLKLGFYKDSEYFDKVLSSQKESSNKEINRSIISILMRKNNIDSYFEFLSNEFLYAHGLTQRSDSDEVLRGNRDGVNELVLKLARADNFLGLAKYFFNNNIHISEHDDFYDRLIQKILSFIIEDNKFLFKLLESVGDQFRYLVREDIFLRIIKESATEKRTIEYLLSRYPFNDIDYFIARIVSKESMPLLIVYFEKHEQVQMDQIERFRNFIGNLNSRDISKSFNDQMIDAGYTFKENAVTEEDAQKQRDAFYLSLQKNIDLLFNLEDLIYETQFIFDEYGDVNRSNIREIEKDWYKLNGSWNFIDTKISILSHILFKEKVNGIDSNSLKRFLDDKSIILSMVQSLIERYKSSNWEYTLSEEQQSSIIGWINQMVKDFNFNQIIELHNLGSYTRHSDFDKLKTVFYFQKPLNISLPKKFLLQSIRFFEFDKSSDLDENFIELKKLIADNRAFDEKIISNISEGRLIPFSLSKHIAYAIKFNLEDSYVTIREYFKNDDSVYNDSRKLEEYILVSKDIELLIEIVTNNKSWNHWSALKILSKHKWKIGFCREKAVEYLDTNEEKFRIEAISILFALNSEQAIVYFLKFSETDIVSDVRYLNVKGYSANCSDRDLKALYFNLYSSNIDRFDSNQARSFYFSYIINLGNKHSDNYQRIIVILNEIKSIDEMNGKDLFYINVLIEDFKNNYILSKSKPFILREAKHKCDQLLS
jgi:DNA polymerase III delta prime subunit